MLEIESSKHGAELTSIKLDGIERLHQANNVLDENGKPYWGRHAPILFPFVGRVIGGVYRIGDKEYPMKTQHGFARDKEFECGNVLVIKNAVEFEKFRTSTEDVKFYKDCR